MSGLLPQGDLALWALKHPERLPALDVPTWELLIRQARRADVLARVAARLQARGLLEAVPTAPRAHLQTALTLAQAQSGEVRREAALICAALGQLDIPLIFLKGAAYVLAGLPAAEGRLFSDTDILVPRQSIPAVEGHLMMHGWMGGHHDAYDQHYYRVWMHELPPMEHVQRHTVLDVHHNILPLTTRHPPDAALLLRDARRVESCPGASVLAPPDMVLHSMTHLFHNDDLSHGLRDLSDLDALLRHFCALPGFWNQLLARAEALGLQRSLHYGAWATQQFFDTPMPADFAACCRAMGPTWPLSAWMPALWRRGLRTPHASAALRGTGLAQLALTLRAHWLRMPPLMLARHLSVKAWKRLAPDKPAPATAAP